jgi:hypothetical protein
MIKALIRTILLIVLILIVVHLVPTLAPYQTIALVAAVISGLFGFITRALFVILLVGAAVAAYFFWH